MPSRPGSSTARRRRSTKRSRVSVDGERVAVLEIDRWYVAGRSEWDGHEDQPIPRDGRSAPHLGRLRAHLRGPGERPHRPDRALASPTRRSGLDGGFTILPHLRDAHGLGPFNPTGVSDTPSRRRIFSCRPHIGTRGAPVCAERIVSDLARWPIAVRWRRTTCKALMTFYDDGCEAGGFEARGALRARGDARQPALHLPRRKRAGDGQVG
jgi:hypothetical protein